MRKLMFVVIVTFLVTVVLAGNFVARIVPVHAYSGLLLSAWASSRAVDGTMNAAPLSIHQGDLILSDSDVYTIEGRFDMNGSIIVKENATLILRDAFLNFTQSSSYQYNMTFQNPLNGYPRLLVDNATVSANDYYLYVNLLSTSTAMMNQLSTDAKVWISMYEYSSALVANSTVGSVILAQSSSLAAANSTFGAVDSLHVSRTMLRNCTIGHLAVASTLETAATNCTINDYLFLQSLNANFSVAELKPGFAKDWSLDLNCSVAVAPIGWISNVTLHDTWVGGWSFDARENSNATIFRSELVTLSAAEFAKVFTDNSIISQSLDGSGSSTLGIYNTAIDNLASSSNSTFWLINSTYNTCYVHHQSRIHVSWYLDVHVIDAIGQNVSSASVTIFYPNATVADSESTGSDGWARFALREKTINATAEYPVGIYTVEATYGADSNNTAVGMAGNKEITLSLDFIVTEFASFLILPLFTLATLLAVIVHKRKQTLVPDRR